MSTKRTSELTALSGRRVLVTRSAEQAPTLAAALIKLGVEPVVVGDAVQRPPNLRQPVPGGDYDGDLVHAAPLNFLLAWNCSTTGSPASAIVS